MDHELDEEVLRNTKAEHDRQVKSLRARERKARKQSNALRARPPTANEMRACNVYIDSSAEIPWDFTREVVQNGASILERPEACSFFIASNPWEPLEQNVSITAILGGGWILTPGVYLLEALGPALKFKPALGTRRHVWASEKFKTEHPDAWLCILETADKHAGSKWKFALTGDEWAEAKHRATRAGRASEVLALIAEDEVDANVPHAFELTAFLKFIQQVDSDRTSVGIGNS